MKISLSLLVIGLLVVAAFTSVECVCGPGVVDSGAPVSNPSQVDYNITLFTQLPHSYALSVLGFSNGANYPATYEIVSLLPDRFTYIPVIPPNISIYSTNTTSVTTMFMWFDAKPFVGTYIATIKSVYCSSTGDSLYFTRNIQYIQGTAHDGCSISYNSAGQVPEAFCQPSPAYPVAFSTRCDCSLRLCYTSGTTAFCGGTTACGTGTCCPGTSCANIGYSDQPTTCADVLMPKPRNATVNGLGTFTCPAICGDGIIDEGEDCDPPNPATCCSPTCMNLTALNVYSPTPTTGSISAFPIVYPTQISLATLGFTSGGNYLYNFSLVSAVPDPYTYVPHVAPVFTLVSTNFASPLVTFVHWTAPIIGTYIVTISTVYCPSSGAALYFTRNITSTRFGTNATICQMYPGIANGTGLGFCQPTPTPQIGYSSKCDCSLHTCSASVLPGSCGGTICGTGTCCPGTNCTDIGYYTKALACADVLSPKPVTFTVQGAGTFTCNATCGDGIIDHGEECDNGPNNGVPGNCCTNTCSNPINDIPTYATVYLACNIPTVFSPLADVLLNTSSPAFTNGWDVVSWSIIGSDPEIHAGALYLNEAFTGPNVVLFRTQVCNSSGDGYQYFTRNIYNCYTDTSCSPSQGILDGTVFFPCCMTSADANASLTVVEQYENIYLTRNVTTITVEQLGFKTDSFDYSLAVIMNGDEYGNGNTFEDDGVFAIYDSTMVTFNQTFNGTLLLTFTMYSCFDESPEVTFYRNVSYHTCGNGILEPGEDCDNDIPGGCCLSDCAFATSENTINPTISSAYTYVVTSESALGTWGQYNGISLTVLGFANDTLTNYPTSYEIISYAPTSTTWEPFIGDPHLFIANNTLHWRYPYIGTYTIIFGSPICTAANASLYFEKNVTLQFTISNAIDYCIGNDAICTHSSTLAPSFTVDTDKNITTKCDCSIQECLVNVCGSAFFCPSGGNTPGYTTCSEVCEDLLSPKPIDSILIQPGACGGSSFLCDCPAVCGDSILDTGETCDTGGAYGSCCTLQCVYGSPNIGMVSSATINASNCSLFISTVDMQLNTTTNNFDYILEIDNFTYANGTVVTGVDVYINITGVFFSTSFTETVVITFKTLFCTESSTYVYLARTVIMNCCGNYLVDLGEECDAGTNNGQESGCCTTICTAPVFPSIPLNASLYLSCPLDNYPVVYTAAEMQLISSTFDFVYEWELTAVYPGGFFDYITVLPNGTTIFGLSAVGPITLSYTTETCSGVFQTYTRIVYACFQNTTCSPSQLTTEQNACCLTIPDINTALTRISQYKTINITCKLDITTTQLGFVNGSYDYSPALTLGSNPSDAQFYIDGVFVPNTMVISGVLVTFNTTVVTFNQTFKTLVIPFFIFDCEDGNPYITFYRNVTYDCCGNGIVDPYEECDPPGWNTCCTSSCMNATVSSIVNPTPLNGSYSTLPQTNPMSVTLATLGFIDNASNYPLHYALVSAVHDRYTYVPNIVPVWSLTSTNLSSASATSLTWNNPFIGTYIVTISTIYCNSSNASLTFTRNINMPYSAQVSDACTVHPGSSIHTPFCQPSPNDLTYIAWSSRCDCSLHNCTASISSQYCSEACGTDSCCTYCSGVGYLNPSQACPDILVPKPVTFNLSPYGPVTCGPICGDGILDTGELCDLGASTGTSGSCCTNQCQPTGQTLGLTSLASINPSVCSKFIDTTTMQLNTTTNNFNYTLQVSSVTDTSSVPITDIVVFVNTTGVFFNTSFTGTIVIMFEALFCANTSTYIYVTRTVTMDCCGNSIVDIGEQCDLGEDNGGLDGTCCTSECTFISQMLNYVCRGAANQCDVAETCPGTSAMCPPDQVINDPESTCDLDPDVANSCIRGGCNNGTCAIYPSDIALANETCFESEDDCIQSEYCFFNSTLDYYTCPQGVAFNDGDICRPSANDCDAPEYYINCTCPPDEPYPSGHVCRNATDECDATEMCNGVSFSCPADGFQPNTYICWNSTGICSPNTYCSGINVSCPSPAYYDYTVPCRPKNGTCDKVEFCLGNSSLCPEDNIEPEGTICINATYECDIPAVCDGVTKMCPAQTFYNSSVICRESNGTCDRPEYCTGGSARCPVDVFFPYGFVCNASEGSCETSGTCNGYTATCPQKTFYPNGTVCRPAPNPCDIPEVCPGNSSQCPPNLVKPAGTICFEPTGPCVSNASCDGTHTWCPAPYYYGPDVECRPAIGDCDMSEYCNYSPLCPPDKVAPGPDQVYCGDDYNEICDMSIYCDGFHKICPIPTITGQIDCVLDGDLCFADYWNVSNYLNPVCVRGPPIDYNDNLFCNGVETCNSTNGLKVPGTPVDCNDYNSCTRDTCINSQEACSSFPIVDINGTCGGGLGACTPGYIACDGSGEFPIITCVGEVLPVNEICGDGIDNNCDGYIDEYCTPFFCSTADDCLLAWNITECRSVDCVDNMCAVTYFLYDTPCDDGLRCTTNDVCDGHGLCQGAQVVCNDYNDCTYDYCDEDQWGRCVFDGQYWYTAGCISDNPCSASSQCNNQGQCVDTSIIQCGGTPEQCVDNVCMPETGNCELDYPVGTSCTTSDYCVFNQFCLNGECIGSVYNLETSTFDIPCMERVCSSPCGNWNYKMTTDGCYIDSVCVDAGASNPLNPCEICNASSNTFAWSIFDYSGSLISCDDGDFCTFNDTCINFFGEGGEIVGGGCSGTEMNCTYLQNECADGYCIAGQCKSDILVGNECGFDLYCQSDSTCDVNGNCVGTPRNCSINSTQCAVSQCNEEAQTCVLIPEADYTHCVINNDICDGIEYCFEGQCIHSNPLNCSDLSTACTEYTCDPVLGCVSNPLYLNNCSDNNVCTLNDFCSVDGVCYPGWMLMNCDDGNPCTEDSCHADIGCQHVSIGDCSTCISNFDCPTQTCQTPFCVNGACQYLADSANTRCSDGNACNGEEYCSGNGVCVSFFVPICDDGNECTDDSCDPSSGCVFTPLTGNMCDDGDACTSQDVCIGGVCAGTEMQCQNSTDCMDYTCETINGNPYCVAYPTNADGSCSVEDACQVGGVCSSRGVCVTHNISCPPPDDFCTESWTCSNGNCIAIPAPEGTPCNQDNLCQTSQCDAYGDCNVISYLECPQTNGCANVECVPATGECFEQYTGNGGVCAYLDVYNPSATCIDGDCVPVDPMSLSCAPSNQCQQPGHLNEFGDCIQNPMPDYYPCLSDNICAQVSVCLSGACTDFLYIPCNEHLDNPCYYSVCDPVHGCLYYYNDGLDCDDNNECTVNTTCSSGTCGGGESISCYNDFVCGLSYCSPEVGCLLSVANDCASCSQDSDCPYYACKEATCIEGQCMYEANDLALSGCNDGQFCNGDEQCMFGTCTLGIPPDCDDGNLCTSDACDYERQQCIYVPTNYGSSCENNDLCATAATCDNNGNCLTVATIPCETADPCVLSGNCNPSTGACEYLQLDYYTPCYPWWSECAQTARCFYGQCVVTNTIFCPNGEECSGEPNLYCSEFSGCGSGSNSNGDPCNDFTECTMVSTCNDEGICVAADYGGLCDDPGANLQCQFPQCIDEGECIWTNVDDGVACDTGMARGPCSGSDVCSSGNCIRTYNEGFICREADLTGCDIADTCILNLDYCPTDIKVADGTTCDKDTYCFNTECQSGQCVNVLPRDCSDYNTECTQGYCDEINRQCTYQNLMNGLPCTGSESGQCVAYASCYYGACAAFYSDVSTSCSDGNTCTQGAHCSGFDNTCVAGTSLNCSSYNSPCTVGVCNPLSGLCMAQNANEAGSCNADSNPCTVGDACHLGTCVAGPQMNCSYLDSDCQHGQCIGGTCTAIIDSSDCSPTACTGNCTVPFEWWASHNSHCPSNRLFTWPNQMESQTICGQQYYQWSQVQYKTYAWRFLFQQWLAAKLNVINGACVPNNTLSQMTTAYSLLSQCNVALQLTAVAATQYKTLAISLYSYNTGAFGPGLCNPTACLSPPYGDPHCLFLSGLLNARFVWSYYGDGYPEGDEICLNGQWDPSSLACDCFPGWSGSQCTDCADTDDGGLTTYVCVPSFHSPWSYTLRRVATNKLDKYLAEGDAGYRIIAMTGRSAVLPNTNGLDCGCRPENGGIIQSRSSRDLTVSGSDGDITVYLTAVNEDLTLCTEFFDIVVSSDEYGSCTIDGVYCISDDDGDVIGFNGTNTSLWGECDCCRDDDEDCSCAHDDDACIRAYLRHLRYEAKTYRDIMIYFAEAIGMVTICVIIVLFYNFIKSANARSLSRPQKPKKSHASDSEVEDEEESLVTQPKGDALQRLGIPRFTLSKPIKAKAQ